MRSAISPRSQLDAEYQYILNPSEATMPWVKLKGTRQGALRRCVRDAGGKITKTYTFERNEPEFVEEADVGVILNDLYVSLLPLEFDPIRGKYVVVEGVVDFGGTPPPPEMPAPPGDGAPAPVADAPVTPPTGAPVPSLDALLGDSKTEPDKPKKK